MGITSSNKELSATNINCGGSFSVKLSLTAAPDIVSNPTDIVLILDRSGSMEGSPIASLKSGAKKFIQIIDEATDGSQDGQIGSGSHIGIVSFASTATKDTQLITSVAQLNAAVDALDSDGFTNHADAFTKALQLFDPNSTNAKVMVMFTDGVTTRGGDPTPIAQAAKAQGVIIYAIGLSGNGGLDEQALEDWASSPASAYVAITPDDAELEELFENLARNITNPGATDIVINDVISPCFKITSLSTPTKGTATLLGTNSVKWQIDKLGVSQSEGAVFQFTVEHLGSCSGLIEVNDSITYDDNEGNIVTFPSPEIDVDCGNVIIEPCPTSVEIPFDGCSDTIEYDAGDIQLESLGRILKLDATIKNVCPHKRVALAVIITETDSNDVEHRRGLKTLVIPAHNAETCRDITIRCIKFVLPEELNVSGSTGGFCGTRFVKAKFIANYIDTGFECCTADD